MKAPFLLPVLFVCALAAAPRASAAERAAPPPSAGSPSHPEPPPLEPVLAPAAGLDVEAGVAAATTTVDAATKAALKGIGWKALADGSLARLEGPGRGYVPRRYLDKAGFEWKDGALAYKQNDDPVDPKLLPQTLSALADFAAAAETPAREAGRQIAAWGLPPVFDGRRLVDADGSATYYGQMTRWIYAQNDGALPRASAQRLSQAFDLLGDAYGQAFYENAPDAAKADIERAKAILFMNARPGESPIDLKPYEDLGARLAQLKAKVSADIVDARRLGDEPRRKDSEAALAVLNQLEQERFHDFTSPLPDVPAPGRGAVSSLRAPDAPSGAGGAYAPLASGLPGLLRTLDRINGKPLTSDQQENLIKSFPMGELVWKMGVQDLWRQGLTGRGVKVAIIDQGIGHNPEIDGAVDRRVNLTSQRGGALEGEHATHVAGILHALAPEARISGYTAMASAGADRKLVEPDNTPQLLDAIDRAVADGNRVISMSLGNGAGPSEQLARKVESYAKRGVIFVISAGNSRDAFGVGSPSVAPNAITVGNLDSAGRMADSSSYGSDFDPRKIAYVVKTVFMAPGTNIYSTQPRSAFGPRDAPPRYALMSGTSMAAPAMAAVASLLVQAGGTADPVKLSARVREALAQGSTPMTVDALPPNAPLDQSFLVVRPLAALDALRRDSSPSVAGR
ncbi:MAG: S8 family serine peptidase [Elusimicrobia bacterium]|nr:S8 family serine peptidase [Elusimicrobiota bacterium]